MIITLFYERDLFRLAITFKGNILNNMDSTVYKLLFRKKALENQFSVCKIKAMKVLSLNLLLCTD